ncbi:hypothetical protein [Ferrimonas futtsuensis]|uniref:hypothetical protein n=1 Tax=Ferrimonas futtsuensis TaxID=364764 RepID=UPI0003F558E6|nr:hypothetical protein [Ferrimonas futtsuensis]
MKHLGWLLLVGGALAGCASNQEFACGVVASGVRPPAEQGLFQVMVTHIDGQPVVSKASYRLPPGEHQLRLVELIDDPRLGISLRDRSYREMTLKVEANQQFSLAARFDPAAESVAEGRYWEPTLWQQHAQTCSLE